MAKKKKIIIIDAFALIFRAYYALPPLKSPDGMVVNAVYGFMNTLLNIIKDYKPDYLCVAFDEEKPTFRKEMYQEYKAQRQAPPEDFKPQIPILIELLQILNIKMYSLPGYEADDVIGSICAQKSVNNKDTISYILTGDLDTLQLVDDNTKVITFKRGMSQTMEYDELAVKERYAGLTAKQMIDMKAIKGDASDNIPGVKGIGEKGAINLLTIFGTLENVYKNIESEKIKKGVKDKLLEHQKMAMLSKELVTIKTDLDINFNLEDCAPINYDVNKIFERFNKLGFKTLTSKLPKFISDDTNDEVDIINIEQIGITNKYILINDDNSFNKFLTQLKTKQEFTFNTKSTDINPLNAKLLGISFSWDEGEAFYLSINNKEGDGLFAGNTDNSKWLNEVKIIFEDNKIKKIGHNIKLDIEVLKQYNINIQGIIFDTMVAEYLLDAGEKNFSIERLALNELGHNLLTFDQLSSNGKEKINIEDIELSKFSNYNCENADYINRLYKKLKNELKEKEQDKLMNDVEMPLVSVLASMELNGVLINVKILEKLSKEAVKTLKKLEKEIIDLAGVEFNVASPLQLQEILFINLGLSTAGIARTKTGYSTAASELEKLKGQHKIIPLLVEYRELSKFQSTYLEALPELIDKKTGRIHTSYNQTVTATGRLSSSNPNLQNIPIKSDFGKQIREAFIAPKWCKIITADYSQIELRLAAHYSQDSHMIQIFKEGKDIHTSTAAKIHKIDESQVTKEIRSTAKEINFGIIYGLGAFGLAQRTDLDRNEAKEFIEKYFTTFPGIKNYIEKTIKDSANKGYSETLFGRRRYLPELMSNNGLVRSQAERIAINMPLQGTAADLIKIAMINIQKELSNISQETKMIMQVHDELVFEVPENDVEKVGNFIKKTMENAHQFLVPIVVNICIGDNWSEAK